MENINNLQQLPVNGDSPWLLYGHKQTQTLYSISPHNPKPYLKCIPQLRHKKILDFTHGWFVLRDWNDHSMFSLFNPITSEVINLPRLLAAPEHLDDVLCALKSPPDRDDCLFLLCFNGDGLMFSCSPAKPNCSWVTQPLEVDVCFCGAFTLHGVLYAYAINLTSYSELLYEVRMDASNSLIIFRPWLQVTLPCDEVFEKKYMVESCGNVYFVCLSFVYPIVGLNMVPRAIKVFELDLNGLCWKEIKSLNGRSFFLGCSSCTWSWGTTNDFELGCESSGGSIQSNCIYLLLRYYSLDGDLVLSLYSYNLNDHSFMPLQSCPNLVRPIGPPVFWVTPQHQRLLSMKEGTKKADSLFHNQVDTQNTGGGQRFRRLLDLPLHIIECIPKYMHLFEYWNFRASCNVFRSFCPAPGLRSNNVPPLFLLFKNNNSGSGSCELIDPIRCDSRFNNLPLSPHPFTLQYSNKGWLLTLVDHNYFEFFNLFTGDTMMFPLIPDSGIENFWCIAFSTYPTNPDCWTVAIHTTRDGGVRIFFLQSSRGLWEDCRYDDNQGIKFAVSNSSPVYHEGAYYFLDKQGYLGVFQMVDGAPNWKIHEKPQTFKEFHSSKFKEFHSCNLVECQGQLYSVFIEKVGKWVQVFRFDESVKSWVEIKCLGNQCFFISRASSFSFFTRDRRMRNRIYLPRFRGNKMIYYSLDTFKYHVVGSEEPLKSLYGTSEPSTHCWI